LSIIAHSKLLLLLLIIIIVKYNTTSISKSAKHFIAKNITACTQNLNPYNNTCVPILCNIDNINMRKVVRACYLSIKR